MRSNYSREKRQKIVEEYIAQKRLDMATWPWPNTSQEAREINTEQFEMLLERGQKQNPSKNFMNHSHFFLTLRKWE